MGVLGTESNGYRAG